MSKMYRQGDVLMVQAPVNFALMKPVPDLIVEHGEVTGHKHQLRGQAALFVDEHGEKAFEVGPKGAEIFHDEHDTIGLPEGSYKVIRQREYDEKEISRYVRD